MVPYDGPMIWDPLRDHIPHAKSKWDGSCCSLRVPCKIYPFPLPCRRVVGNTTKALSLTGTPLSDATPYATGHDEPHPKPLTLNPKP